MEAIIQHEKMGVEDINKFSQNFRDQKKALNALKVGNLRHGAF